MKHLIAVLSLSTLLISCSIINPVYLSDVSTIPILCEMDNQSMEYCFMIYAGGTPEDEVEVEAFNNSWLEGTRFIAYVPSSEITVLVMAYANGYEGGVTHYSESRIYRPVAYNWGEVKPTRKANGLPEEVIQGAIEFSKSVRAKRSAVPVNGHNNEDGQIMYKLAPLKPRD